MRELSAYFFIYLFICRSVTVLGAGLMGAGIANVGISHATSSYEHSRMSNKLF